MKNLNSRLFLAATLSGLTFRNEGDATAATATIAAAPVPAPVPEAPSEFVEMVKNKFHFKKDIKRDDAGNVVKGEDGKPMVGSTHPEGKHPSVELYLPVPKVSRLVEFLSDTSGKFVKEVELLKSAVFDTVYNVARGQINDFREKDVNATVNMATLNFDKLDWTAIANMPKAERGAWAPSEEDMKTFLASYKEKMPAITGKDEKIIDNHILILQGGFKKQRGQKEILELFVGMLSNYVLKAGDEAVEDNKEVVEYLLNKLDRWLKTEEKITMDML